MHLVLAVPSAKCPVCPCHSWAPVFPLPCTSVLVGYSVEQTPGCLSKKDSLLLLASRWFKPYLFISKKRVSVWFSEKQLPPLSKTNRHHVRVLFRISKERHVWWGCTSSTWPPVGQVWGEEEQGGAHGFQLPVTLLTWGTALWIWTLLYWIFYDLVKASPYNMTYRGCKGFLLMKTWTFPIVAKPHEMQHFQSQSLAFIFSARVFMVVL